LSHDKALCKCHDYVTLLSFCALTVLKPAERCMYVIPKDSRPGQLEEENRKRTN